VTGRQRTRTLAQEVFVDVFRFRSVVKDSPPKAVTALAGLERWRGFCGDDRVSEKTALPH
jgi:hypothetical protein